MIDRAEAEARRRLQSSEAGLLALVGGAARPASDELTVLHMDAASVEAATAIAFNKNPELQEARLAAEARAHAAEAVRRERLPGLGIEGRFEYGRAPGRARQDNPFVYDAFNVRTFNASFALRWDLSFRQTGAKVARERAEAEAARAKRDAVATHCAWSSDGSAPGSTRRRASTRRAAARSASRPTGCASPTRTTGSARRPRTTSWTRTPPTCRRASRTTRRSGN